MSGGTLQPQYCYYQVNQFADELENEIENNDREDERNYNYAPHFNEETLKILRTQLPMIRKLGRVMKEIDYLYSGDHGEDSFRRVMERLENES